MGLLVPQSYLDYVETLTSLGKIFQSLTSCYYCYSLIYSISSSDSTLPPLGIAVLEIIMMSPTALTSW